MGRRVRGGTVIPAPAPIGRQTRKLDPELWQLNEAFSVAITSGNIPEAKRISKRLNELEAANA